MHAVGAQRAHEVDAVLDQEGDIALLRRRPQPLDGSADRVVSEAGRAAQQQAGDIPRRDRLGKGGRESLGIRFAGQTRRCEIESRCGRGQVAIRGRALESYRRDRTTESFISVIPANAGIQKHRPVGMDAGFRRHDSTGLAVPITTTTL
jgi:hypothetical protein